MDLQTITGNIIKVDGTGAAGANVTATIETFPQTFNNELISSQHLETTISDKFFALLVLKGSRILVTAKDSEGDMIFRKSFTVTTDDTKDISTYL